MFSKKNNAKAIADKEESTNSFQKAVSAVTSLFDRDNPRVRTAHDLIYNVALFGAAVWAIHRYGHKLAV